MNKHCLYTITLLIHDLKSGPIRDPPLVIQDTNFHHLCMITSLVHDYKQSLKETNDRLYTIQINMVNTRLSQTD